MQAPHTLHAYDYVNHPYERVRSALVAGPKQVFCQATSSGVDDEPVLRVQVAGLEIGAEIAITLVRVEENEGGPVLEIDLAWQAAKHPGAFPTMTATLRVFPLTPTETQLAFEGTYVPPLGPVGTAVDATVGHRFAEAAVSQFVREVATYLREHLVDAATADPARAGTARTPR
jgi:hypothetical protein